MRVSDVVNIGRCTSTAADVHRGTVLRVNRILYRDENLTDVKGKGKGFPYSILSVGPGADPGVQGTGSQPAGDR